MPLDFATKQDQIANVGVCDDILDEVFNTQVFGRDAANNGDAC